MQSILAQVDPLQPTGAGRRRHGDHRVVVVLVVGHHGHLVFTRRKVMAHTDWILTAILGPIEPGCPPPTSDILAGIFGEGHVLGVDDGTPGFVMPAGLVSVGMTTRGVITEQLYQLNLGNENISVRPVVGEQLDTKHVRVMHQDMAGGDVDHQLVLLVVLVLVHQQKDLVLGVLLVQDSGPGIWWYQDPILSTPLGLLHHVHHTDGEEVGVAKGRHHLHRVSVLHHAELTVVAEEDLVVFLVGLGNPHTPRSTFS